MSAPDQGAGGTTYTAGQSGSHQDIRLVRVYEVPGGGEAKARFEDQFGLESLQIGTDTVNVFDTHAETMWFATAQAAPASAYPTDAGQDKKPVLCPFSPYLVPPNPRRAGAVASRQGPVYRILEEEVIDDEPQGYISTRPLEAVDYLEDLDEAVASRKARVAGTAQAAGGVLFPKLGATGSDVVSQCVSASGKVLHVMNNRGVAQVVGTGHGKKSRRADNLKKWAEADQHGDFAEWSYRIEFDYEGGWHVGGFEDVAINSAASLGMTFEADGRTIKSVKPGSPASVIGINDDIPWRHLVKEGSTYYDELSHRMRFAKFMYSTTPDAPESSYQVVQPFDVHRLDQLLASQGCVTLVLVREELTKSTSVRAAIDEAANKARSEKVKVLQRKSQEDGWYVRCEDLPETAFPPGEKADERQGVGPFPGDWPGYFMRDEDGHFVRWDPKLHAEPVDDDFYAREFVKNYCYVLCRGSTKGPSGPSGDKWMGLHALYAALFGYEAQGKKSDELDELFPDRNADTRRAYIAGLTSQLPREWTEPYAGADPKKQFKASLLRLAYFIGFNNPNKKADDMVPDTDALRKAYKNGKRAVCVGVTPEVWSRVEGGSVTKDMYKNLAVPIDYVNLGRSGVDDPDVRAAANSLCRAAWEQGVDDAWDGRQQGRLTEFTADDRIPDVDQGGYVAPRDAFRRGSEAGKRAEEYLRGMDAHMSATEPSKEGSMLDRLRDSQGILERIGSEGNQVRAGGGFKDTVDRDAPHEDFQQHAKALAFKDGLALQWMSYLPDGKEAEKPDERYPYTLEELRKAFEDGAMSRARDDKKKNVSKEVDDTPPEKTCCESFRDCICWPCDACAEVCCPVCTENPQGGTLCCGTSYGDWLLILCCFAAWYTFLGMWYWALIEVMFVVAEPQRPW